MSKDVIVAIAATAISLLALWVACGRLLAAAYPIWRRRRNEMLLRRRLAQGRYDGDTIRRSTRYYVMPKCTNIDPAQEVELRRALAAVRQDLFTQIDSFLSEECADRHALILADSGTGKTSCILNYYARNEKRPRSQRHRLALVPLGIPSSMGLISAITDKEETALFLDALDEDVAALADHQARVAQIMETCRAFRRVLITCRTQFFPKDEEIPVETGVVKLGPRKAGERPIYEFRKLYLAPFDDGDIREYLRMRYPFWRRSSRRMAFSIVRAIPNLAVRPMLLAHVPDLVDRGGLISSASDLYEDMIASWIERETAWVEKDALREFSERLAVNMFAKREERGMERIPVEELRALSESWRTGLHSWQIGGRSLLNRDAQGNYKFAHRSIMEYLFVERLLQGDPDCEGLVLTDQMKAFLMEKATRFMYEGYARDCLPHLTCITKAVSARSVDEIWPSWRSGVEKFLCSGTFDETEFDFVRVTLRRRQRGPMAQQDLMPMSRGSWSFSLWDRGRDYVLRVWAEVKTEADAVEWFLASRALFHRGMRVLPVIAGSAKESTVLFDSLMALFSEYGTWIVDLILSANDISKVRIEPVGEHELLVEYCSRDIS